MPELNEPAAAPALSPEEPPVPTEPVADTLPTEPASPLPSVETPSEIPAIPEPAPVESWPSLDQPLGGTRHSQPTPVRRGLPITVWLAALLVPYAIGSTVAVAYLFQQQQRNKQPHILESIPDQGLYEDFLEGRRRETIPAISKAAEKPVTNKIIPPNEPVLPEMQPIKLGETRRIGMLSVKPIKVEKKPLVYRFKQGKPDVSSDDALFLTISVKNEGNILFRPDDETFNRAFSNEGKAPVYTFLELGKDRFYGAIADPTIEQLQLETVPTLLPSESTTMQIVAYRSGDGKQLAADAWKPGTSGIWRVHLRKGKEEITMLSGKKRSVWVTTVVPVEVSFDRVGKVPSEPAAKQPQKQEKK